MTRTVQVWRNEDVCNQDMCATTNAERCNVWLRVLRPERGRTRTVARASATGTAPHTHTVVTPLWRHPKRGQAHRLDGLENVTTAIGS